MKGLLKTAPGSGNMEIRDTEIPKPGPGEVLLEVKSAGICGSDLHIYHWNIAYKMKPSMIVGHDFSGVVVESGDEVAGWEEKPITLDFERIAYKELAVTGSLGQRWTAWKRAIRIMTQGRIHLKAVISDRFPLTRWKEAFDSFEAKEGLKILLDPKT
jgi:threonine dehydrogenase-like Zn-dependent dehydrogenase